MDKDNNPTLKINEINEYYKSGDYPKYIITQITTGIDKFKSIKKEYDLLEEQLTQNIQSKEQDKKTKDDLWKITMLHLELDTGEKALDELNNQLEIIREWDNLPRSTKRRFLELVQDCNEFSEDRWGTKDNHIKDIKKINKEYNYIVDDLELSRCTRELMQPLYKIGNNLDRIKTKYKID